MEDRGAAKSFYSAQIAVYERDYLSQNANSASFEKPFLKGMKHSKLKADKLVESNLTVQHLIYLTEIQAGKYVGRTLKIVICFDPITTFLGIYLHEIIRNAPQNLCKSK